MSGTEPARRHDPLVDVQVVRTLPVMHSVYVCSCGWTSQPVAAIDEVTAALDALSIERATVASLAAVQETQQ